MRKLTKEEVEILQRHARYLETGGDDGKKADLRGANLRGANIDFACWPLWCGSKDVKADDRLVAQLIFHVTRLDVSQCSGGVQEAMEHIRSMAVSDLFCEYRGDVKPLSQ